MRLRNTSKGLDAELLARPSGTAEHVLDKDFERGPPL
jgi:hypothetical protein